MNVNNLLDRSLTGKEVTWSEQAINIDVPKIGKKICQLMPFLTVIKENEHNIKTRLAHVKKTDNLCHLFKKWFKVGW